MVASLEKGIVTTPTLFGLDPNELVKDSDPEAMNELKTRKEKEQEREQSALDDLAVLDPSSTNYKGNITFTHYDDVNSLIENTSGEQHIRGLSRFAWVQADHSRYILSSSSGSYLTIKIEERNFLVTYTQKLPKSLDPKPSKPKAPYTRPFIIATTSTFEDAVNAADTYAKKKFVVPMILTSARWRRYPATLEQIAFLNKFREEGKKLEVGGVTKGRAADWITKIKFGARGRLKKMQSETAKAQREQMRHERLEEMQRRSQVRVGPVDD
jgi:ATP-dependent helicase IRC3